MNTNARLKEIRWESDTIGTWIWEPEKKFEFKAGQWISVDLGEKVTADPRGSRRPFTISASPTEGRIQITTKISASGFKQALKQLGVGEGVRIEGPNGNFCWPEENKSMLMLAGGMGITPIRSMIRYAFDRQSQRQIGLGYAAKNVAELVFFNELKEMTKLSQNLKFWPTITGEKDQAWEDDYGRIDKVKINNYTLNNTYQTVWICGPAGFTAAMWKLVLDTGWEKSQVFSEDFPGY